MPLPDFLHHRLYAPLSMTRTFFSGSALPLPVKKDQIAATEDCTWRKKIIRGSVHDENAFAIGGYSGHSGLFGTAWDIRILLHVLRAHFLGNRTDYFSPETVRAFFTRQDLVKDSTWALGWDTPSPQDSSSGKHFSEKTVGHLGFTGTSVWMDLEQDVLVIFLTNRVHPTRKNEKIKAFRPQLHDLIMEEIL
jgi:CubicO group peptidase (beta-lactamase class C family)